ncbi:MAG: hypothetical protein RMK91_02990 [Pseudanabaenaceae cyanobacterium SKYGB_i_bin29]|nr:hypothetical protein [Pseudanabaenaceae cyanobacterium SKYG29]MDW8420809.1 hypothetical protein [Pseudanabaenaceae cyanobacterium SKYGB_i_bin29]
MKDLSILVSQIEEELQLLQRTISRIQSQVKKAKTTNDEDYWHAVAANLVSFYTGMENIFKLIANNLDNYLPQGADWHIQLLRQMQTGNSYRPAVIQSETLQLISEYRSFRHVFMNNYALNLDSTKLDLLAQKLPVTYDHLHKDMKSFAEIILKINGELQS